MVFSRGLQYRCSDRIRSMTCIIPEQVFGLPFWSKWIDVSMASLSVSTIDWVAKGTIVKA